MHQMYEKLSLNPITMDSLHNVNSIFITTDTTNTIYRGMVVN